MAGSSGRCPSGSISVVAEWRTAASLGSACSSGSGSVWVPTEWCNGRWISDRCSEAAFVNITGNTLSIRMSKPSVDAAFAFSVKSNLWRKSTPSRISPGKTASTTIVLWSTASPLPRLKGRETSAFGLRGPPDNPWIAIFDGWRRKVLPGSRNSRALGLMRVTCDPVSMKHKAVRLLMLRAAIGRPPIAGAFTTATL